MDKEMLFNVVAIGGVAGFAAYCGSYASHVWRSRNAAKDGGAAPPHGRVRRLAVLALWLGALALPLAYVVRYAGDRAGDVAADGIYTVRAPDGCTVDYVAPAGQALEAGAVLARFGSPKLEAQAAALALKQRALEAEQETVRREPVELDAELVRREQELATERRHLQASRDQLVPARDVVARERLREQSARQDQLNRLRADRDRLTAELAQAKAKRQTADTQLARIRKLASGNVASSDELMTRQTESKVLAEEVAKIEAQLAHAAGQIKTTEGDLKRVAALSAEQSAALAADLEQVRGRLTQLPAEEKPLRLQLASDRERARARAASRLQQLDAELQQCRAELDGINRTLTVTAPFAGRVAFRERAPNNAQADAPLLVLGGEDAFRLRVRLPEAEAAALAREGTASLELREPAVERRFEGRAAAVQPLAGDPGYALAELTCLPPADAVRALAGGEELAVVLRWVPPLYTTPLFRLAAGLVLVGFVGTAAGMVRRIGRSAEAEQGAAGPAAIPSHEGRSTPLPAPAGVAATKGLGALESGRETLESGEVAAMLRLLGNQLREAIARGAVDLSLLAAVEWALDRHHVRAVRLLGAALGEGDEAALSRRLHDMHGPAEVAERLVRVLRAIGGPRLREQLRHAGDMHGHPHPHSHPARHRPAGDHASHESARPAKRPAGRSA